MDLRQQLGAFFVGCGIILGILRFTQPNIQTPLGVLFMMCFSFLVGGGFLIAYHLDIRHQRNKSKK